MEDLAHSYTYDEQFSANGYFYGDQGLNSFLKMSPSRLFDSRHDLKFLCDWQDHEGLLQDSLGADLGLKCNMDLKTDVFDDGDSPILSNNFSYHNITHDTGLTQPLVDKEKILFPGDVEPLRVSSSIQTDNVLKRIAQARSVLINGEKEILGKNIIGLHSLNEIKSSPEDDCQITSTVINGKRYKIIIRRKPSTRPSPENTAVVAATANKMQPADELITELQNGDYDVLGGDDYGDPWYLNMDGESNISLEDSHLMELSDENLLGIKVPSQDAESSVEEPRVPPLRIKIPKKTKKHKTKRDAISASSMTNLLDQFEKIERQDGASSGSAKQRQRSLEAPCAVPQDNVVSSSDSVQLDHDYCTYMLRQEDYEKPKLVEKNPRKDSGLESGGVSDASEGPLTPETPPQTPLLAPQLRSKLLEERRRSKDHQHVTKMAAALFRAANAITSGQKNVEVAKKKGAIILCDNKTTSETVQSAVVDEPTIERPKKKLKLEEYRSRVGDRQKEDNSSANNAEDEINDVGAANNEPIIVSPPDRNELTANEQVPDTPEVPASKEIIVPEPSNATGEEELPAKKSRERSRPLSRRRRRSSSSSSSSRSTRHRRTRSVSRDRRRSIWSPSRRSSSRDSSSSSSSSIRRRSDTSIRYRRRTRSRSRSTSHDRTWSRNHSNRRYSKSSRKRQSFIRRSRSPMYTKREKNKQIEERRVIYVGRIAEGTTNNQLRQRFSVFGPIVDISVHFRERGDNYGFVTFAYKSDAYQAVEHGNDDTSLPHYDLCFGGRRSFCKQRYSDLDGMPTSYSGFKDSPRPRCESSNFDYLLKQAKEKLRKRKDST